MTKEDASKMDDNTFAALVFSLVGLVYIGFGIPLLLGRIPPNAWYGCRTRKTLSSEEIWYPVNRVTGRYMIISGVAVILSAFGVFVFRRSLAPNHGTAILLVVLVLSVLGMFVESLRTQRNFEADKSRPQVHGKNI
jgi:uncharacterized membrane protein